MFYEEIIVDGVLCFRTSQDGETSPLSAHQLTARLLTATKALNDIFYTAKDKASADGVADVALDEMGDALVDLAQSDQVSVTAAGVTL